MINGFSWPAKIMACPFNVTIVSVLNWEELDIRKQKRIGEEEKSQKWTRQDYIYCTCVGV